MTGLIETLRTTPALIAPDGGALEVRARHETHSALVLCTEALALKVRKPVDLGFLDYSTRARRHAATHAELALGRRISPWIYTGAWSLIFGGAPTLVHRDDAGEPVLAMTALEEKGRLDRVVQASPDGVPVGFDDVADFCAAFHAQCPVDRMPSGRGEPSKTWAAWEVNFTELPGEEATLPLPASMRRHLIEDTARWWRTHQELLQQRVLAGRVCDGHGDLRVEHVYTIPRVALIDPLEFAPHYRFTDVGAEVGFLVMELLELRRPDLADRLLERYTAQASDDTLRDVLPFFVRYRAVVRAKVEWIRALQIDGAAREVGLRRSQQLFELAARVDLKGAGAGPK